MSENVLKPQVAVITSTIGRDELAKAIESVAAQTYPCKHYVFVDGEQYADKARKILQNYPHVTATYLPMNTGANGWVNSSINAIAPFLVKEEILCYLDDDNTYQPNHIELLVNELNEGVDFAHSLRNFYDLDGNFICEDNIESLGGWQSKVKEPYLVNISEQDNDEDQINFTISGLNRNHIDTNCYAFRRHIAVKLAQAWYSGVFNDRNVLYELAHLEAKGRCSGKYTVNYALDIKRYYYGAHKLLIERGIQEDTIIKILHLTLKSICNENIRQYNGKPWCKS